MIRYDANAKSFRMENTSGTHEFAYHHEKSFSGMYAEWAEALNTGKSDLLPGGEDGMKVADIARRATDAAIMNRRTKRCSDAVNRARERRRSVLRYG